MIRIKRFFRLVLLGTILIMGLHFPTTTFAETIILKSGRKVEGKIIEKTSKYIKIDFHGVPLTYYFGNIESIDGESISTSKNIHSPSYIKSPQDIFKNISPSVVSITTETVTGEGYLGTGFIVNEQGVIVTNYHVVHSAKKINVKLKDGRVYSASIIYYNLSRDICILKIEAGNLSSVSLGNSDSIQVGERVYSIGNPAGLEYSLSEGLISGIRNFNNLEWLQFTAPISPGNSGGPIINAKGKVIGITTASFSVPEGQNLNFALAVNEIKPYISTTSKMTLGELAKNKISWKDIEPYFVQANKYHSQGNFKQALAYYQKVTQIAPTFADIYINISSVYMNLGQYQQAIAVCQKAIQINPNIADLYHNLGFSYQEMGQYQKAIAAYQKIVEMNPNIIDGYYNLGNAYSDLGQHEQAISYLQKAIEISPNDPKIYYNLGFVYNNLGQYQQAINYYQKALQIDPNFAEAYVNIGSSYSFLNQKEQAIKYCQKAIQINPSLAKAYIDLGTYYIDTGQRQQALAAYQKGVEIEPDCSVCAGVYINLGILCEELSKYGQAKKYYQKAKELFQVQNDYEWIQKVDEYLNKLP